MIKRIEIKHMLPSSYNLNYTIVRETIIEDVFGHRIRYGNCEGGIFLKPHKIRLVLPNQLIAFQRWVGGPYGTTKWLLYIFRAMSRTLQSLQSQVLIPDVYPAVELLLFCSGATRVKRTLAMIAQIEGLGIRFDSLKNEYWIHQNARLASGKPLILPKETF